MRAFQQIPTVPLASDLLLENVAIPTFFGWLSTLSQVDAGISVFLALVIEERKFGWVCWVISLRRSSPNILQPNLHIC